MPDIVIKDVPETISLQLSSLAATEGIEVQEIARRFICDAVAVQSVDGGNDITIAPLQDNMEAYFRLAERQDLFMVDEQGERFVLISIDAFNRLTKTMTGDGAPS